jgi:hypothetical protein
VWRFRFSVDSQFPLADIFDIVHILDIVQDISYRDEVFHLVSAESTKQRIHNVPKMKSFHWIRPEGKASVAEAPSPPRLMLA